MMEQPESRHGHGNVVFIAGLDDIIITDRTAGLGNIIHTAAVRPLNVIAKGEEGIAAQGYPV